MTTALDSKGKEIKISLESGHKVIKLSPDECDFNRNEHRTIFFSLKCQTSRSSFAGGVDERGELYVPSVWVSTSAA